MRRTVAALAAVGAVFVGASACGFEGPQSVSVPGAPGTGDGSYEISAMIPSAAGLVTNAPIMLDDATVGSIGVITVKDWNADVVLRLNKGTQIPRGSQVMVGMTSVLGSSHLEILQPENAAQGMMTAGEEIGLTKCPEQENLSTPEHPVPDITAAQQVQACTFPTTEQVLSSLSVVLNGGGLAQFGDTVHELNNIFVGRHDVISKLLPRLNRLVGDLNSQRDNIIRAMEGIDRLTTTINQQTPTLQKALSDGPQILKLLVDQRQQFTATLAAVGRLSSTTNDILTANDKDLRVIVKNLVPVVDQLSQTGPALTQSLGLLLTFPFYEGAITKIVKGDYVNSDLTLDLTFERLGQGLFSSLMATKVVGPEGLTSKPAGAAKRGLNPFTSPGQSGR
ncbi:MCE family protein [Gordonia sp. TBRC 11910]|uniref:MCE family protein n=2 Tax=Gordonia asplenii TaxID=2725283 RepID=A0A848L1Y0_9ACTN|nr:MCE family protein [Gordonia asplenii]